MLIYSEVQRSPSASLGLRLLLCQTGNDEMTGAKVPSVP